MITRHFFIFRVAGNQCYDFRLPDGGVVVHALNERSAITAAYRAAERQLPCKPGEIVVCHPVRDPESCHQAWMMQDDWQRALAKFEELMGVRS